MKVETTIEVGRFNLVDDTKENRCVQQLSKEQVITLGKSIMDLINEVRL